MSSPTKPFAELQVTKSRKRGDTTSLLPSSYDPNSDAIPEAPVPEASPSLYTREPLQQSLVYAERCLKRQDVSPRYELFMQLYKEELKDALKAETTEQRENHAMMVMAEERLIQDNGFLQPLKSAQKAELEDQLLQLRELGYLVRYGDYMKIIPTRLRLHASKHKLELWQSISGNIYWSRIAVILRQEEEAREKAVRIGSELSKLSMPTTATVYVACTDLGISEEFAIWSIEEYGTRDRKVHRDLDDLKREGEFPRLAATLWADRNELSSIFSSIKSETNIKQLRGIIQNEIDTWFDTSDNPDLPTVWVSSPPLRQIYRDALQKANKPSKDEIERPKEASIGTSSSAGKRASQAPKSLEDQSGRGRRLRGLGSNDPNSLFKNASWKTTWNASTVSWPFWTRRMSRWMSKVAAITSFFRTCKTCSCK